MRNNKERNISNRTEVNLKDIFGKWLSHYGNG